MACHCLTLKDAHEFYSLLKQREPDLVLKMVKCVLSAQKRNKENIDIWLALNGDILSNTNTCTKIKKIKRIIFLKRLLILFQWCAF